MASSFGFRDCECDGDVMLVADGEMGPRYPQSSGEPFRISLENQPRLTLRDRD
jgi:hypothetical protein